MMANVTPVESEATILALGVPGVPAGDDGTGGVDGPVMTKLTAPDVPPPGPPGTGVKTVTGTDPALARSVAVIAARSWVALTKVVVRAVPFQRTTEELAKPLPFTVSVKPELLAEAVAGERVLATGTGVTGTRAGTDRPLQA
jgi:hypothetical protein